MAWDGKGKSRSTPSIRSPLPPFTTRMRAGPGFASAVELIEFLKKSGSNSAVPNGKVFRVAFHYVDVPRSRISAPRATPAEVAGLVERLDRMDSRSARGPWTMHALQLIRIYPRTAASRLAPRMNLETLVFKANIRKLKRMGLTISFDVGYGLTPLGEKVWRRHSRKRKSKE